jgi:hypothetical protein
MVPHSDTVTYPFPCTKITESKGLGGPPPGANQPPRPVKSDPNPDPQYLPPVKTKGRKMNAQPVYRSTRWESFPVILSEAKNPE